MEGVSSREEAGHDAGTLVIFAVVALHSRFALSLAATVPADGAHIVDVTVYPDRAEVVREVRLELRAGPSTVEFANFPLQVEGDSLRVTAKGVPATIGAVELKEKADRPGEIPEFVAAQAEVKRLQGEIASLDTEEATDSELRSFITSLKAATAKNESEKLGQEKADPASLQAMYALVRTSLQELAKDALSRTQRRETLQKELEVALAKLSTVRPAGSIRSRVATVEVATERAGPLTLRLAYVAPGAGWRPAYRASLDVGTGDVSLVSEAVVRQSCGEDWSGVTLRLSTAAPARGVTPPVLTSWLLRPAGVEFGRAQGGFANVSVKDLPVQGRAYLDLLKAAPGAPAAEQADEIESAAVQVDVIHSSYNVAFQVPGKSDVPADGSDHRVGLRQETLAGKIEYRTVPALHPAAYLLARTKAPGDYPLLAGPVRVFAAGAYLGGFSLEETAPGAEFTLPFGIDNRVQVERVTFPRSREQGLLGKERRLSYTFRTTVENLRDEKANVMLEDRVPVSEDERVQVEKGKGTTPGAREDRDRAGALEWALDLAPREKREVVLEYTVRFPRDLLVLE